ncbi:hypothetical protein MRX96_030810 [Rhipicephalus microplus]
MSRAHSVQCRRVYRATLLTSAESIRPPRVPGRGPGDPAYALFRSGRPRDPLGACSPARAATMSNGGGQAERPRSEEGGRVSEGVYMEQVHEEASRGVRVPTTALDDAAVGSCHGATPSIESPPSCLPGAVSPETSRVASSVS